MRVYPTLAPWLTRRHKTLQQSSHNHVNRSIPHAPSPTDPTFSTAYFNAWMLNSCICTKRRGKRRPAHYSLGDSPPRL